MEIVGFALFSKRQPVMRQERCYCKFFNGGLVAQHLELRPSISRMVLREWFLPTTHTTAFVAAKPSSNFQAFHTSCTSEFEIQNAIDVYLYELVFDRLPIDRSLFNASDFTSAAARAVQDSRQSSDNRKT